MRNNQGFDPIGGVTPIERGTSVYDVNGDKIGSVDQINGDALVIQKGLLFPRDISVPLAAVRQASADGLYLSLTKDQVQAEDWSTLERQTVTETRQTTQAAPPPPAARTETRTERTTTTRANTTSDMNDVTIPVREEELVVNKEYGQIGQVHVHKDVVEESETITEPVRRERVHVEFDPVDENAPVDTRGAFQVQDVDVPVMGEQLEVEKHIHTTGQVHLYKEQYTEQEQESGTVRKERVNIEGPEDMLDREPPNRANNRPTNRPNRPNP